MFKPTHILGVTAASLLSSCGLNNLSAPARQPEQALSVGDKSARFEGPYLLDSNDNGTTMAFVGALSNNPVSFHSSFNPDTPGGSTINMDQFVSERRIVFCKEQLEIFGFRKSLEANELTLSISEGQLQFLQLPLNKSHAIVSVPDGCPISIICSSALLENLNAKYGLLVITGKAAPYACTFCYENSAGEIVTNGSLDPQQFKTELNWHRDSVEKISKDGLN